MASIRKAKKNYKRWATGRSPKYGRVKKLIVTTHHFPRLSFEIKTIYFERGKIEAFIAWQDFQRFLQELDRQGVGNMALCGEVPMPEFHFNWHL